MINKLIYFCTVLCLGVSNSWGATYFLVNDPIDVVIVAHSKDKVTLDLCIDGVRENCENIRRIVVVSQEKLSDNAEWFDEGLFPFTKDQVAKLITDGNKKLEKVFFGIGKPAGWYLQQLLKLYASFVIPNLSSNVLVLDADTIFLNPVQFTNEKNGGLFCLSKLPAKDKYFRHAKRLVPGYKRQHKEGYSVCHHMLFQKPILDDLFRCVEEYHQKPLWKAFCLCVDQEEGGASEYEIYFSFACSKTKQVDVRPLKWIDSAKLEKMQYFKERGYHFVAFHDYLRESL